MIRSLMCRLLTTVLVIGVLTVLVPAASAAASAQAAPIGRSDMGMAYDAADGQVVLFGGLGGYFGDTWTWDGTDWTKLTPAHSPPKRWGMGTAYDAADGQVVLFGGEDPHDHDLGDTWTWDGTDWTQRTPAHSPPPRLWTRMAYDAARGQIVLFGGCCSSRLGGTWTWDGTDWTKRTPAHSPPPRQSEGMAYDAARGQIVLFGGEGGINELGDTWTWDGTDWRKRTPAHSPQPRREAGMTYGVVPGSTGQGQVVLFGGFGKRVDGLGDTWTWDGTDWTKLAPAHSPSPVDGMGMAFDAARGQSVLFGGYDENNQTSRGDTWIWDGRDWTQRPAGSIVLDRRSGPPGAFLRAEGWGFGAGEIVTITFVDSSQGRTTLTSVQADAAGWFDAAITIPSTATPGRQHVEAKGVTSGATATRSFTVT